MTDQVGSRLYGRVVTNSARGKRTVETTSTRPVSPTPSFESEFGDMRREMESERAKLEGAEGADEMVYSSSSVLVHRDHAGKYMRHVEGSEASNSHAGDSRRSKGSSKDMSWLLVGPSPGGPSVPDVIPSFGGHIAHVLWSDPTQDRGAIRVHTKHRLLDTLGKWELSGEVKALTDASGIGHLGGCMLRHIDVPLLCAFIERWQPDTNTFHMPFGEMTIMLHDVAEILGLRINGRLCRVTTSESVSSLGGICEMMRDTEENVRKGANTHLQATFKSNGWLLEGLKFRLESGNHGAASVAQAYLLFTLGTTLFVDKTGDRVTGNLYPLVRDIQRVGTYAWGAGALAYLYRQLGIATRVECCSFSGCFTLLQSWIYEYFPDLRPSRGVVSDHRQGDPRSLRWSGFLASTGNGDDALKAYRAILDRLTAEDVVWCPYGRGPSIRHPHTLFTGVIRFIDVMEPYQPDRCLRQLGFQQVIPSRMIRPDHAYRSRKVLQYLVKYHSADLVDALWDNWNEHRLNLEERSVAAVPDWQVAEDYMDWYTSRSHPLLIRPVEDPMYADRFRCLSRIGRIVAPHFLKLFQSNASEEQFNLAIRAMYAQTREPIFEYYGIRPETGAGQGSGSAPTQVTQVESPTAPTHTTTGPTHIQVMQVEGTTAPTQTQETGPSQETAPVQRRKRRLTKRG